MQTIEDFFSSDVTTVISDAPEWKLRNPLATAPANGADSTSKSPGTPRSLAALTNSPWSPATPQTPDGADQQRRGSAAAAATATAARSRVETILERARQQAKGTSDVIENAYRWGLKIWSLNKILVWLESFKAQIGGSLKRKSAPGPGEAK